MAILIFLLALPFFLFITLLKRSVSNHGYCNHLPPGPPSLPLIGHLHMLMFDNSDLLHIFLWKLSKQYGLSLRLGFRPTLVVSSAEMAKEVMKTRDLDFCSRPNLCAIRKLSYNASDLSFSPYSESWKGIRKICVVHLFSRVRKYRSIREDEVAGLVEKICRLSVDSKPVNLSEAMVCLSCSIISRVGFGKRYGEEGAEGSRLHGLIKESVAMFTSFSFSDCFPFMGWVDRFTGFHARLERFFIELDSFYQQLIDEHLNPNRLKPEQEDILDVLLQTWKDRDFLFDLTLDHIKAVIMVISSSPKTFSISFTLYNVLFAGTETTAVTVIWVMSFLMKNPDCLKKAQEEKHFRLQPAVPLLLPRETLRKCCIGGYKVPANTLVYVNAWAIGRDPEAWKNPEEFCPERFIGSSIDYKGLNFELIPFGAGRRVCPGMHMAVAAVELALANLLYKFDWEMPTEMNKENLSFDGTPGLVTHKKDALILVARKIND
ncbi:hypothetical protein GOBAR_AA25980 [Gossypium barbadense]|uniref:Cytochrome P450 n=1 Tax=Gossypium barbadense TaxID=3634 RepID=A0A2P5WUE8_GOSBA|nr:hypothetical protein GOBAR_AA25980 [Gossypium barbadense]